MERKFLRQIIGPFLFRSGSSFVFISVLLPYHHEFDLLRMYMLLGVIYGAGVSLVRTLSRSGDFIFAL